MAVGENNIGAKAVTMPGGQAGADVQCLQLLAVLAAMPVVLAFHNVHGIGDDDISFEKHRKLLLKCFAEAAA